MPLKRLANALQFGEAPGAADDTEPEEEEEQQQQQDELELDEDDKAWIEDSFLPREQAALSDQKMPGKSLKLHGRTGTKAAARWVNKRAKFDASDLDEAALKSDDDSGGPE